MSENEKKMERKSNQVLVIMLIIILMIAFTGFGYLVGNVQTTKQTIESSSDSKNDTKKEEKETEIIEKPEIKKGECPLTKFSEEYDFSESEMAEIQEAIENEMKKAGAPSFELKDLTIKNKNYDYLISVRYDLENNPGSGPLSAVLFKVNQQYKVYLYGTETTTDKLEELNDILTKICS